MGKLFVNCSGRSLQETQALEPADRVSDSRASTLGGFMGVILFSFLLSFLLF